MKQNQASGQRGDWNLGPPDYESASLSTRPRRRHIFSFFFFSQNSMNFYVDIQMCLYKYIIYQDFVLRLTTNHGSEHPQCQQVFGLV